MHDLAGFKNFPVYTFQAEDEIAGMASAIGAAFGGAIAITTTSGPGMNLKAEAVGLAVKTELPIVITDIQRAGPSTGMPTKPEQADLLMAMYGRHGESPIPIIAASTPGDCFDCAYEAVRIAIKYMTPVILLTDGQLANGAEPWLVPDVSKLPDIKVEFRTDPNGFMPYIARRRDSVAAVGDSRHARAGASARRPLERRPDRQHQLLAVEQRADGAACGRARSRASRARFRRSKFSATRTAATCVMLGWGSTFGPIREAVKQMRAKGKNVSHIHLRYLNPLPSDLGDKLRTLQAR